MHRRVARLWDMKDSWDVTTIFLARRWGYTIIKGT